MKIVITTEVDLDTGDYRLSFRNQSNPGEPMDLAQIKKAFSLVAKDFAAEKSDEALSGVLLS